MVLEIEGKKIKKEKIEEPTAIVTRGRQFTMMMIEIWETFDKHFPTISTTEKKEM